MKVIKKIKNVYVRFLWRVFATDLKFCNTCDTKIKKNEIYKHYGSEEHIKNAERLRTFRNANRVTVVETKDECCICLDDIDIGYKISCCGKYFHSDCLNKWRKQHNNCPMCRTENIKCWNIINKK
jgi:hypothetical protein